MDHLKWDSSFFGFKVSRIDLFNNADLREMLTANYSNKSLLNYVFTKHKLRKDILLDFSGSLGDTKIIFKKKITSMNIIENSLNSIEGFKYEYSKKKMYQLAFLSGKFSRFNTDPNISRNKFEELYKLWVDNSISGKFASKVFVYIEENEIIGFVTLSVKDGCGEIGLIAVDKNHQGKSIGSKLIAKVEMYLLEKGIENLKVPTQEANINAVKFYKKNNFKIIERTFIYHFWNIK